MKCFGWRLAKTSRRRCTLSKGAYCSVSVPHGSDGSNNGTSNARESPKVSLPTVSAPDELQDALDKVLDGKYQLERTFLMRCVWVSVYLPQLIQPRSWCLMAACCTDTSHHARLSHVFRKVGDGGDCSGSHQVCKK